MNVDDNDDAPPPNWFTPRHGIFMGEDLDSPFWHSVIQSADEDLHRVARVISFSSSSNVKGIKK